jgi:hypothetical protein
MSRPESQKAAFLENFICSLNKGRKKLSSLKQARLGPSNSSPNFHMKTPALFAPLALTITLGLVSCSSVKTTIKRVTDPIKDIAKTNSNRIRNIRSLGKKTDIPPIVVVRKDDLRLIESGQQKILAWNRSRKLLSPGLAYLSEDFGLSKLPVGGQLPASGILPPLNPGGSSSAEITPSDSDLPPDFAHLPDLTVEEASE